MINSSKKILYKSFVENQLEEYSGKHININKSGIRYHNQKIDKNKKNILIFGGSAIYGWGVSDNETIPALLDYKLNNKYNIYNYGQGGWTTRHNLALLINLINQSNKTDIVIFYDGPNDIYNCIYAGFNSTTSEKAIRAEFIDREKFENKKYNIFNKIFDVFLQYSLILIKEQKLIQKEKLMPNMNCFNNPKRLANTIIENWKIAKEIVNYNNGIFYAILQPEANNGNPNISHLKNDPEILSNHLEKDVYEIIEKYPLVYSLLQKKIKNYDFIYDFTNAFDVDENIYIDHVHVTYKGNDIIAEKISKIIENIN